RIGPSAEEWLGVIEQSLPGAGASPRLEGFTRARSAQGWDRLLIELGEGYLHALDRGTGDEADLVLADLPDSALRLAQSLGRTARRTIVLDPPGCGASDPARADASTPVDAAVAALRAALDALGVRRYRLFGEGLGGVLAARIATADPRATTVTCHGLPGWARGKAPVPAHPVVPLPVHDAEGAALFTSWYRLRDRFLYDDAGASRPTQRTARLEAPSAAEVNDRHAALWIGPESATLAGGLQEHVRANPRWHGNARIADTDLSRSFE
ncbi:MAG: hypothetical protein RIS35_1236, partial [Pseudomonadota bacterium]